MPNLRVTAAAVQAAPVFLDRDATLDRVSGLVKEAASNGASLIAFPEAFVPGYPDWAWRTTPWADGAWYERLFEQSVDVPSTTTDALGQMARDAEAYLSIGVNERDGGTLYNTQLWLGPDGSLLGRHRKLMPTGGERLIWGFGDGSRLEVFDTPFGRLGGLMCWENYMPLARAALYGLGIDVYVAPTWDNSDTWVASMRHIAKEGRIYVIGVNYCLRGSEVPRDLPRAAELYGGDEDWLARGNTVICGPDGEILAGPLEETEGILYAELDIDRARSIRRQFDAVGHYARPDILRLTVDRRTQSAVTFTDGPAEREDEAPES